MAESNVVVEKSLRSVFVGNIPYEATEEKLRDIFSQAGPVISFKLMYDRESGKPKGYGFCEYKDQETALSAMRNINGFEIGGRPLRVDNACTEKSRMEMQSLMMGPIVESPYGPDAEPEKAPEAISNAVASLPPEQMYELMRQMKLCVRNNPAEARTMLLKNPQLAYALLQAQVVMRIIEPKTAVQILHGTRDGVEPLMPGLPGVTSSSGTTTSTGLSVPQPSVPSQSAPMPGTSPMNIPGGPVMNGGPPISHAPSMPGNFPLKPNPGPPIPSSVASQPPMPPGPPMMPHVGPNMRAPMPPHPVPPPHQGPPHPALPPTREPFSGGDYDLRQVGSSNPRPVQPPPGDMDLRMGPTRGGQPPPPHDNFGQPPGHDFDGGRFGKDFDQRDPRFRDGPPNHHDRDREQRENFSRDPRDNRGRDPRSSRPSDRDRDRDRDRERDSNRDRDRDYRNSSNEGRDSRGRNYGSQDKDFRGANPSSGPPPPPPPTSRAGPPPLPPTSAAGSSLPLGLAGQDQEKASLIMQVLQLSDEQIRMLPPEQQASILQLKEQIQRSSH